MVTSGCSGKVFWRGAGLAAARRHDVFQFDVAGERLLDREGDAARAAQFVLVVIEGARHGDGVERHAVGRREHLRVDDIGGGGGAGPGDDRQADADDRAR